MQSVVYLAPENLSFNSINCGCLDTSLGNLVKVSVLDSIKSTTSLGFVLCLYIFTLIPKPACGYQSSPDKKNMGEISNSPELISAITTIVRPLRYKNSLGSVLPREVVHNSPYRLDKAVNLGVKNAGDYSSRKADQIQERLKRFQNRLNHTTFLTPSFTESPNPSNLKRDSSTGIVFAFVTSNTTCWLDMPNYIRSVLEHVYLIHRQLVDVVFASNFEECANMKLLVEGLDGLKLYDITNTSQSARTRLLLQNIKKLYSTRVKNNLWIHATSRFFIIEDIMRTRGYDHIIHAEVDNLLYGNLSELIPFLASNYKSMAITPLYARLHQVTASFMWIANLEALVKFNDYLLRVVNLEDRSTYQMYLTWLRKFACCKKGGIDPDANGQGILPHAVNEMSMLAHYHSLNPLNLMYFPVIPEHNYMVNRHVVNLSDLAHGGRKVGPSAAGSIWDGGSWGQYLGGTHHTKGRNRGFTDSQHVAGLAMRISPCRPHIVCIPTNRSYSSFFSAPTAAAEESAAVGAATSTSSASATATGAGVAGVAGVAPLQSSIRSTSTFGDPRIMKAFEAAEETGPGDIAFVQAKILAMIRLKYERQRNASGLAVVSDTLLQPCQSNSSTTDEAARDLQGEPSLPAIMDKYLQSLMPLVRSKNAVLALESLDGGVSLDAMDIEEKDEEARKKARVNELPDTQAGDARRKSASSRATGCHTAPFVRCGDGPWYPLWNLHVHSKQTDMFVSKPCFC